MSKADEVFHSNFRDGCDELFDSMSLSVRSALGRAPCNLGNGQLAAMIGFFGPFVRGSVTVRAPISFFSGTHPVVLGDETRTLRAVSDWAGEIANQLLGRLKNKLLPYGVTFAIASPATIYGEALREPAPREGSLTLTFPWRSDVICIRFDADLDARLTLPDRPSESDVAVASGEALVF